MQILAFLPKSCACEKPDCEFLNKQIDEKNNLVHISFSTMSLLSQRDFDLQKKIVLIVR